MTCEMWGKPLPITATIEVGGARTRVCQGCQRFGRVIGPPAAAPTGTTRAEASQRVQRQMKYVWNF